MTMNEGVPGMTLRDWFAGQALVAMARDDIPWATIATYCYAAADAMLAERAKARPTDATDDLLAACEKVVAAFDKAADAKCDETAWADFHNAGSVKPLRDAITKAKGDDRDHR